MPEKRDESFPRANRLCKSAEFRRVFARGKRIAAGYFVVYSMPNHLLTPRLGIQVRAKLGPAFKRNYIKRVVREAFRKMKTEFRQPVDLIFIAEKGILELNYTQVVNEFRKALSWNLR